MTTEGQPMEENPKEEQPKDEQNTEEHLAIDVTSRHTMKVDPSLEELRRFLKTIPNRRKVDFSDYSINPSFTTFEVPYHMKCRDRYARAKERYEKQFQHEIAQILVQQSQAYEAALFNRHMCITTLWPPLHNRHELNHVQRYFFRLKPKQRKRFNYLMNTKIT